MPGIILKGVYFKVINFEKNKDHNLLEIRMKQFSHNIISSTIYSYSE